MDPFLFLCGTLEEIEEVAKVVPRVITYLARPPESPKIKKKENSRVGGLVRTQSTARIHTDRTDSGVDVKTRVQDKIRERIEALGNVMVVQSLDELKFLRVA